MVQIRRCLFCVITVIIVSFVALQNRSCTVGILENKETQIIAKFLKPDNCSHKATVKCPICRQKSSHREVKRQETVRLHLPAELPELPLIYRMRKEHMMAACSRLHIPHYKGDDSDKAVRLHLFVDRRNSLIYCGLEKVGCTFWKRVLQITSGIKHQRNPFDISPLEAHDGSLESFRRLRFDEIIRLTSSSKKFMFVREPYSRLFAGYIDKLFSPDPQFFYLRRQTAELTRSPDEFAKAGCAPYVTFAEFIKRVNDAILTGQGIDGHFSPMYDHCRPCALKYDIIGKMESFSTDVDFVIKSNNLNVEVNHTERSTDKDDIKNMVQTVYGDRDDIVECMSFQDALKLLWKKCQIRGFIDKSLSLPEIFLINQTLTASDMEMAILAANAKSGPNTRANRREALIEAVRTLSRDDLAMFRKIFLPDFELFGYNVAPRDLFWGKPEESNFSFFVI